VVTRRKRLTIAKGHLVEYEASLTGAPVKDVTLRADGSWISPK
jgi:hypothetical protein